MINYNFLTKFIHDFILGNKLIKKSLFEIEKIIYLKKVNFKLNKHVFISSLPRSGTTILLNSLYTSGSFASLKYSNMPFITSPNLSRLFYKKKINKTERPHKDGLMFDLDSPESFDEVFFSTYSSNQIKEDFENYVNLILLSQKKQRYLSKNNLNYKRIDLIKSIFPNSVFLIPIRYPLYHAQSLFEQHKNFIDLQKQDDFVRRYMNYLGHNEFGLNHECWHKPEKYDDKNNINYWLEQWLMFYKNIYKNFRLNNSCMTIIYENLTSKKTSLEISDFINVKYDFKYLNKNNYKKTHSECDKDLILKSQELYQKFLDQN